MNAWLECTQRCPGGGRASRKALGSDSRGFAGVSALSFLVWVGVYALVGARVGDLLSHAGMGAVLGAGFGLAPGGLMAVREHYGPWTALFPVVYLASAWLLPPGWQLRTGIIVCLVPVPFLAAALVRRMHERLRERRDLSELETLDDAALARVLETRTGEGLSSVIRVCGRRGAPICVPGLVRLLEDPKHNLDGVRCAAARALLAVGTPEARRILAKALAGEKTGNVRNGELIELLEQAEPPLEEAPA